MIVRETEDMNDNNDKTTEPRDVRNFGAIGDGRTDDTVGIQAAVDECAASGGGVVRLHRGTFLSGGIRLRSHVELHLTSTAVLRGVAQSSGYVLDDREPYHLINRSLLFAEDCEHVALSGPGAIDGGGERFGTDPGDVRPVAIRLRGCRQVRISDVQVKDAASFAVHLIQCRQIRIDGLQIDSQVRPNNDGLDIDGCQDVFVSNCSIVSGDDSIALKALEPGHPCTDVVITNCILSSHCAAIRVGPDAIADIERVTVSNCVIRDAGLNGVKIQQALGARMRDMIFSNLVMENATGPISLRLAGWATPVGSASGDNDWMAFDDSGWERGELSNIQFANIRATVPATNPKGAAKSCIQITGTSRTRPRRITFSNLDITFPGGGTPEEAARRDVPDLERSYPEITIFGVLPAYAVYIHHADDITFDNARFDCRTPEARPAIVADDVTGLRLERVRDRGREGVAA